MYESEQNKIAYLQLIQEPISRLSNFGVIIKGFAITSMVAITFTNIIEREILISIPMLMILMFMFLDSYYFLLEKKYRFLYNKIALSDSKSQYDYSLNINQFDKNIYIENKITFLNCLLSKHIILFYCSLLCILIIFTIFIHFF